MNLSFCEKNVFTKEMTYQVLSDFIASRISLPLADTPSSHFRSIFHFSAEGYAGNCTQDHFTIWEAGSIRNLFYPVITGKFVEKDGKPMLDLNARLNPIGKMLSVLLLGGILCVVGCYSPAR